jgi:phage terminase small subunit
MAEEPSELKPLTEKQKIFCQEYIYDYNGSRSYKAAYKNVNDATARANASDLLTKTNILTYIDMLKTQLAEMAGISPLMVIREHKKIAFSSIAHLHNTWIELKEFEELSDEQKQSIQEIETKKIKKVEWEYNEVQKKKVRVPYEVEYVKIKLYDKIRSLDSINKMLGYDAAAKTDIKIVNPDRLPDITISVRNYDKT